MLELFTKLADVITYDALNLVRGTKLADAVHFFIEDTTKIFFLLAAMIYLISFTRSYVSPEKVRLWLTGKSRFTGYFLAVLLGAVTPFCSCSSVPLFIAFLSAGIPLGVTMAFLITSPMVDQVVVVLLGESMGLTFTIAYIVVGSTGERIRDKIAASKKKGIWMGGTVPTGYDIKDRKLLVNKDKECIQYIYQRYLELGCVRLLKQDLTEKNKRTFSRGSLYHILGNPIYAGLIRHKGVCHTGQHEGIIEAELWQKVQDQLKSNTLPRIGKSRKSEPSILVGKLFDDCGRKLTPDHAHTNGKRYRYYKSINLASSTANQIDSGWRLPAQEIELAVISAAQKILSNKFSVTSALQEAGVPAHQIPEVFSAAHKVYGNPIDLVKRVDLQKHRLRLTISLAPLLPTDISAGLATSPTITEEVPMHIKRRGAEMRMVIEAQGNVVRTDPTLIRAITRAHQWFEELASGQVETISQIARREKIDKRDAARILSLAFLAPDIVEAIIAGKQPADMTANVLIKSTQIPLDWKKQKNVLGFN